MCGDSPPPAYKGPGDAHSNQEWIWQRERYLELFDEAPEGTLRGESTPFYLYNRDARRRIAADNPDAKLIAVLRDPVDRAYSNWMHLWMDGLEPRADIVEAVSHEQKRIDAGWAPFWHYSGLGMYGRQLKDLFDHFPREQVLLLRYKDLVDEPRPGAQPGLRLPRCRGPGDRDDPLGQLPAVRARRGPGSHGRPGHPRRRGGGPVPAAEGLAHGQQAADQPAAQGRRPVAAEADPGAAPGRCWRRTSRTSSCSRSSPVSPSSSGGPTARAARSRAGVAGGRRSDVQRRDQVVRPVGPGQLEVEPGRAVGLAHRAGVAQGAVGVGRAQHRRVGSACSRPVASARATEVVSCQLSSARGAAVVQHHQRVVGEHGGDPGAAGVPAARAWAPARCRAGSRRGRRCW